MIARVSFPRTLRLFHLVRWFFTAPVFPDDEAETRRVGNLFFVLRVTLFSIFFLCVALFPFIDDTNRLGLGLSVFNTAGWMLLIKRGMHRVAALLYVGSTWLTVMFSTLDSGGTASIGYIGGGMTCILLAGFLLRRGHIIVIFVGTILFGILLWWLEVNGWLPMPRTTNTPITRFVTSATFLMLVSTLIFLIIRSIEEALMKARSELQERSNAETSLRESESRYRIISEMTSDYTYAYEIGPEGQLTPIWITDDSFTRLTGYNWEDIGPNYTLYHPDDLERVKRHVAQTISGEPVSGEYRILTKSGELRWLRLDRQVEWDPVEKRPIRMFGSGRDITERKQAEEAIRQLLIELEQKASYLTTLNEISYDITALADLDTTLKRVLSKLQATLPLDVFYVALSNPDLHQVTFPLMYDEGQFWEQAPEILSDSGWVSQVLQTAEPMLLNRTAEELAADTPQLQGRLGATDRVSASILMAPLKVGDEIIGVISVHSYTLNEYDERHIDLLVGAGYQIAIAIENARLFESLQSELLERRRLEAQLQQYNTQLEKLVDERTNALRRANEQLELILNNTWNALAFADPRGDILVANPAFRTTFSDAKAIEYILWALDNDEQRKKVGDSLLDVMYSNESRQLEVEVILPEGQKRDVDITLLPLSVQNGDQRSGVLLSGHDITQLKDIERLKARFVADAVHDLATPISGLSTRLYLLQRSPEKLQEHVRALDNQVQHLRNLLDDLRTLSRMDRGHMSLNMQPCDINILTRRVFDTYEPVAIDKGQRLTLRSTPDMRQVMIDQRQIERVLVNLVANAVNYSPGDTEIQIVTTTDEDEIVVSVIDQGMGIDPEDQEHIFERFYRTAEARRNVTSGTGLGLAISREIVELHGGSISVISTPGQGSTFRFALPLQQSLP